MYATALYFVSHTHFCFPLFVRLSFSFSFHLSLAFLSRCTVKKKTIKINEYLKQNLVTPCSLSLHKIQKDMHLY